EGVVIRLADELAAAGGGEVLEGLDHVRGKLFELVEHDAGDGVADAEVPLVAADQVEDQFRRGAVALVRDLAADFPVLFGVEVEGVRVEDRVSAEPEGLMDLEVENDGGHGRG